MDKLSNYREIVKALIDKKGSINDTCYDNMLKKLNIIRISPVDETAVKIFEEYTKTKLNDSNTELIIDNINKYGKIKIYGDFFRRILPGTAAYTNASKVARLFCDEEYLLDKYTNVVDLIVSKQEELRKELSKNIRELICESRIDCRFNEYSYFDSVQDTEITLNTIEAILGATTNSELIFELKYILGKEIKPTSYRFNLSDIKVICEYFDIDYSEIKELYKKVR